jgi:uncharacterized SAM-binding protein YcdF (DUF218 family)
MRAGFTSPRAVLLLAPHPAERYDARAMARFLGSLLTPLAAMWAGLVLFSLWRLWRRRWRSALGAAGLAALLYAIGATRWSAQLLASLERPYAGVRIESLPAADAVVMLGGLSSVSTNDLFGLQLDPAADRVIAALEVVRRGKARTLVLGGGWDKSTPNPGEGELLRGWIVAWGLSPVPVQVLGLCQHTRDEAVRTKALADAQGWTRIILVTSAAHMRRAEATFRRLGLEVACYACDFEGLTALQGPGRLLRVPGVAGFARLDSYLHERAGWWMYRWRDWL